MAMFQHPHLTRGVVQTSKGAFVIIRGLVSAPDEIGEALGWQRVDSESALPSDAARLLSRRGAAATRAGAHPDGQ